MVAAAVVGSAVVGGAAGIYGASQSAKASKQAAQTQADAAAKANDTQLQMFEETRADQKPYLQAGTGAVNRLADLVGTSGNTTAQGYGSLTQPFTAADFVADPGYQFSLEQGQKALERSAAAKGGLLSGAALKAAQTYGQGTAAQEYNDVYNRYNTSQTNIYNRLAGLSGTGQTAANQLASTGTQVGSNIASNITGAGNAQAAGQVGAANAWSTGLSNLGSSANSGIQNYMLSQYLAK